MHVLFDLDGTLTDPKAGIAACIDFALAQLDIPMDPNLPVEQFIGPPLHNTFLTLCRSEKLADRAVKIYRQRYSALGLYENRVYAGIPECLERVMEKARSIHVATSKAGVYSERIIAHFQLGRFFKSIHGSNLDGSLSDKTELLAHILEHEKLPARNTVMIGDRSFDIIAARNHGMRSIGVTWGFGSRDELIQAGAASLCNHPSELYGRIFV